MSGDVAEQDGSLEFIGGPLRGGQGLVWRAQVAGGADVAFKKFNPQFGQTPDQVDAGAIRFKREIEITSSLEHPNIVPVLSSNVGAGTLSYTMPWATSNLADLMGQYANGMPLEQALQLFRGVVMGVGHAHEQGVLHRDLKPENILMYSGVPKVADFGLGRAVDSGEKTMTQSKIGWVTRNYMAPEQQIALHMAEKPADVYSLGVILFVLTTGRDPVEIGNLNKIAPREIVVLLNRCIAYAPEERYQDAGQLLAAVDRILNADVTESTPPILVASDLVRKVQASDGDPRVHLQGLEALMLANPFDSALYLQITPLLGKFALSGMPNIAQVLSHYCDRVSDLVFPYEYADSVANLYRECFELPLEVGTQLLLMKSLLLVAHQKNRYHAGDVFAELAVRLWSTGNADIVESALAGNPDAHEFIRVYLEPHSMPASIRRILFPDAV